MASRTNKFKIISRYESNKGNYELVIYEGTNIKPLKHVVAIRSEDVLDELKKEFLKSVNGSYWDYSRIPVYKEANYCLDLKESWDSLINNRLFYICKNSKNSQK